MKTNFSIHLVIVLVIIHSFSCSTKVNKVGQSEINNQFFEFNDSQFYEGQRKIIYYEYNTGYTDNQENLFYMDSLFTFLQHNGNVIVEIGVYTSCLSSNEEYNILLTERRAKNIEQDLINRGINDHKMFTKGYGSQNPIFECKDSIYNEKNIRKILDNERLEIKILRVYW